MDLFTLSKKYGTNKLWHGYISFYTKLFNPIKDNVTQFLEIGIDMGSSLHTWKDYFKNSSIYGIDINIPDSVKNIDRMYYAVADQSNKDQLLSAITYWNNPTFDIIMDDGGHCVKQQRVSIETLWPLLNPGGYYIIEDLHTNIRPLHFIHPHMNEQSIFIDETPTIHDKINNIMSGSKTEFSFPVSEIDEILYFNCPKTLSLTCAFKKIK